MNEKVYITRDEGDNWIWVWRKPEKGIWAPQKLKDCDVVNWQRSDSSLEGTQAYTVTDFKKKFGFIIRMKTKKFVHLPKNLLQSEKYQLFSDPAKFKRKKS
jgi:hypothetical protein